MPIPKVSNNNDIDEKAISSCNDFVKNINSLKDRSFVGLKIYTLVNIFLWHIDFFEEDKDPVPIFIQKFKEASDILITNKKSNICQNKFSQNPKDDVNEKSFEDNIHGLFGDVFSAMSDEIYFDESYDLTKLRFNKNNIDPEEFFSDKIVLDAGCGGGKFSAVIAKFGAKKVIGVDLSKNSIDFAIKQSKKTNYSDKFDYKVGSLLDLPIESESIDIVWSNGVIHHTLDYEKCLEEFYRVGKKNSKLYLFVNGRLGLFELLLDTLRKCTIDIPRKFFQAYLINLGVNTGRIYWMMDCMYAPYEWKSKNEVIALLEKHGYTNLNQLKRGSSIDIGEKISTNIPYAQIKFGDGPLKFIASKAY